MVLGTKENDSSILNIGKNKIKNSTEVTLLGVKIDKQLKFKSHIEELYRKAAYKLHALRRIRKYLAVEKPKLLDNAFINSTAQKMKFSIKDFFNKCDQICSFLRIWSDLLEKSLMENFIFCAV